MQNFNLLPGKIKSIKTIATIKKGATSRTVEGIIVDYVYNSEVNESKRHKLNCFTLKGNLTVVYIDENTVFSDIEIDENAKNCLQKIRASILRKREAQKIIEEERITMESLTNNLLFGENVISRKEFISLLTSELDKLDGVIYAVSDYGNNYKFNLILDSVADISFEVKRHYVSGFKISGVINTGKFASQIEEIKDSSTSLIRKDFIDAESKKVFFYKYGISDILNDNYYNLLSDKELLVEDFSYCGINPSDRIGYYVHHSISRKEGKMRLNEDIIEVILNLVNIFTGKI